ncbi:MAG: hypothetical protein H6917_06945 [Novosphingobium sp.]|nr:hypothetical protein [Novosphingobium sp.]MCP5402108.1 hypothetical protein [Novosphingobium sp.]
MDLNRLYSLHQLALIRAASSDDANERKHHNAEADSIAARISDFQLGLGADSTRLLPADAH